MKILFLLYPTHRVKVDEDSSFWMMFELLKRGHEVGYFESSGLFWRDGSARCHSRKALLHPKNGFLSSPLSKEALDLGRADAIFIRKEPPFDTDYLHVLQMLAALKTKTFILNDPEGIARCNEKLFIVEFPEFITDTLVTSDVEEALRFARSFKEDVVVKPLDQKAGNGIFRVSAGRKDFHALVYAATLGGARKMMFQRYLPVHRVGDKRILVLNGKILGAFLRRPAPREFRANLSLGGSMHRAAVTSAEKKMVEKMAPELLRRGLYFTGLDVIDGYLSEINVTSPSGIPEMKQLYGKNLEKDVADFIEARCL